MRLIFGAGRFRLDLETMVVSKAQSSDAREPEVHTIESTHTIGFQRVEGDA